jgi:hypothetical protein
LISACYLTGSGERTGRHSQRHSTGRCVPPNLPDTPSEIEMITVLAEHKRRAVHGLHRCGLCRLPIAARSEYIDQRCADGGTVWTWREHIVCRDVLGEIMRRDDIRDYETDGIDAWWFADSLNEHPDLKQKVFPS